MWCLWTVVLEKTLESPLDCKEIQPVHPKGNQSWMFVGRTDVEAETPVLWYSNTWCKELTHWKRPWCWERLRARGEGDDREWDGWRASPTQWTWVWVSSRSWWWTGRPGVLQSMGSQRVRHDWATELNWTGIWTKSPLMPIVVHRGLHHSCLKNNFRKMSYNIQKRFWNFNFFSERRLQCGQTILYQERAIFIVMFIL